MIETIKHIDPSLISDVPILRALVQQLLQFIETLWTQIQTLTDDNQKLRDEVNRLKGEKGKPTFPKNKEGKQADDNKKDAKSETDQEEKKPKSEIQIDRIVELTEVSVALPADARIKSYEIHTVQNIELRRDNVQYRVAIWYSASENKTYRSDYPLKGYGSFGPEFQGLLHLLHYECNVTQGCLESFSKSLGIQISSGSIDNILKSKGDEAILERSAILASGLAASAYTQADSTSSKEKGVNLYTQIICSPLFTAYFSNRTKSRLQVLQSLCGLLNLDDLPVRMDENTMTMFELFNVPLKYRGPLEGCIGMEDNSTIGALKKWIDEHLPALAKQRNTLQRVFDAFALAHYFEKPATERVITLMSDDAPEYKLIALIQALCWIHDGRDYKKLIPSIEINRKALDTFLEEYWKFYKSLLKYKEANESVRLIQKSIIEADFERIFKIETVYPALNNLIARTYTKKREMLVVLDYPDVPLHNNASELAARRKVRKRDVSLHTMSPYGTMVQDAYLSIIETAKKLGVSAFEYLKDFVASSREMTPLNVIIDQVGAKNALSF
jgi:regulator of replication initiation timing